jgi:tetratricopeptide (TPR) repeat protein
MQLRICHARAVAVVFLLLQLMSARAPADEDESRVRARAHFKAATALYEAGEYDQAIVEFRSAYELSPLPELLFNIAQAHRLAQRPQQALEGYRRYLALEPQGPVSEQARALIVELEAELAAHDPSPHDASATDRSPAPSERPRDRADATNVSPASNAVVAAPLTRAATAAPPPRRRWLVPVVIAGSIAAVALGVGLGVGLGTSTRYPSPSFGEVMPR